MPPSLRLRSAAARKLPGSNNAPPTWKWMAS